MTEFSEKYIKHHLGESCSDILNYYAHPDLQLVFINKINTPYAPIHHIEHLRKGCEFFVVCYKHKERYNLYHFKNSGDLICEKWSYELINRKKNQSADGIIFEISKLKASVNNENRI